MAHTTDGSTEHSKATVILHNQNRRKRGYNMANRIYTSITEDTVAHARDRVRKELNDLTDGEAQKALDLAAEYNELDGILKEYKKQQTV